MDFLVFTRLYVSIHSVSRKSQKNKYKEMRLETMLKNMSHVAELTFCAEFARFFTAFIHSYIIRRKNAVKDLGRSMPTNG